MKLWLAHSGNRWVFAQNVVDSMSANLARKSSALTNLMLLVNDTTTFDLMAAWPCALAMHRLDPASANQYFGDLQRA